MLNKKKVICISFLNALNIHIISKVKDVVYCLSLNIYNIKYHTCMWVCVCIICIESCLQHLDGNDILCGVFSLFCTFLGEKNIDKMLI
jgi:hypothetical protein